jgi:hypothetical protein
MATKRNSRKSGKRRPAVLGKPNGVIQPRVQAVGPEHFGIVAIDCAKARSKWMLCDFYGRVLIEPTVVEHQRTALQLATAQVREACEQYGLKDHLVAVEMTGTYHRPVQRAFRRAGSETRLAHPFASSHYRLPSHPDNKTDDNDLGGIFRAAINGFGLIELTWDEVYLLLQLLTRHRRDLVRKRAKLQSQIRQYLERCLPGYADLFPDVNLWKQRGVDPRDIRCRVANRATRTVFQMVGGRRLYHHPSRLQRQYVLDKLLTFHEEHGSPPHEILGDLQHAAAQIPKHEQAAEATPLAARYEKCRRCRRKGPQQLSRVLLEVLARCGITGLESEMEAQGPDAVETDAST